MESTTAMTHRERVLAAAARRQPDRVPIDMSIEHGYYNMLIARLGQEVVSEGLAMRDFMWCGPKPSAHPGDFSGFFSRPGVVWGEWGQGRVWDSQNQYAEYLYPLENAETVSDLASYPWPDTDAEYRYDSLSDDVAAIKAQGYPAVAPLGDTFFELAWQLRSMDRFSEDLLVNPEMAQYLLDLIAKQRIATARQYALAGVDYVILGDDVAMQTGMMMSPALWRAWFKPRLAAVISAAKDIRPSIVMSYHSDGDCSGIVPDLAEIGVDVLNPVQPECMPAQQVKASFGGLVAFSGGLGVQSVLPFGSPDEVGEHVRSQIALLGAGGGYIVAPSHVLERDIPPGNFVAMLEALREHSVCR